MFIECMQNSSYGRPALSPNTQWASFKWQSLVDHCSNAYSWTRFEKNSLDGSAWTAIDRLRTGVLRAPLMMPPKGLGRVEESIQARVLAFWEELTDFSKFTSFSELLLYFCYQLFVERTSLDHVRSICWWLIGSFIWPLAACLWAFVRVCLLSVFFFRFNFLIFPLAPILN
jgi:hypothetical protein